MIPPAPRPSSRAPVRRAFCLLALAVPLVACGEDAATRRLRAEAKVLKRQNESLREIITAAREKRLVDPRWLAVAVDEAAFKSVIEAGLPQEAVLADRYRVRVESAELSFRSGTGLVRLRAHVTDEKNPDRQAAVVYHGGLDDIGVSADGRLHTRVLIDHVEVPEAQAAGSDAKAIAAVVDQLAGRNLEALQQQVPPVAIPVRLQQTLQIDGLGDGPVQVDPGELPLQASVARVIPLSGRLWVMLDVKAGPWRERTEPVASPPSSPAGARP